MTPGRIDVHSHLLPGVDDGCLTVEESIACARVLVGNGYSHAFCTPHVWPSFPSVTRGNVPRWTSALQDALDEAGVALKLIPGGEMNLHPGVMDLPDDYIISMGLAERYVLIDAWAQVLPDFFAPTINWLQARGLTVILAHPERMRAVQENPALADVFADLGVLLQGNLQCFGDPPEAHTRRVAEQYLREGRYFMLGSDAHKPQSMDVRMKGLRTARELAGDDMIARLTMENPRKLIAG